MVTKTDLPTYLCDRSDSSDSSDRSNSSDSSDSSDNSESSDISDKFVFLPIFIFQPKTFSTICFSSPRKMFTFFTKELVSPQTFFTKKPFSQKTIFTFFFYKNTFFTKNIFHQEKNS